jgi:hypothetical protein
MLLVVLRRDDRGDVELQAGKIDLNAAAGNVLLYGRAEIVDVELRDFPRVVIGLDVDVPDFHGHARLLLFGCAGATQGNGTSLAARRGELNRSDEEHA